MINITKPVCLCGIALALAATTPGCKKFLSVDAPGSDVKSEVVYSNDVTATSAVLGIYAELTDGDGFLSGSSTSVLAFAGLSSDELVNYPREPLSVEFEQNEIHPSNGYIAPLWNSMYAAIYQSNAVIEGLNSSKGVSEAVRNQLLGEALFMRAFCHFYLVNLFGDVPLVMTTDYELNARIKRTSADLVYDQILADLEKARGMLTSAQSAPYNERIRPNKFAADALLARIHLYRGNWALAESMATELIDHKPTYLLTDSTNAVFLNNSVETIWQLRPTINGDNGYAYEALYFSPDNVLGYNVLRPGTIAIFEPGDHRFRHWIEYLVEGSDTIYFPRKYKQDQWDVPLTEYSTILRLAEQYLIRAEARAMQNKLLGENGAEADINMIRLRAGIGVTNATTQAALLDEILRQRRIELMAEGGHRWFDLKRLGKATQILTLIKPGFEATDELYPLPAEEFRKNPFLGEQNSGY